jgi:hypothetical protein
LSGRAYTWVSRPSVVCEAQEGAPAKQPTSALREWIATPTKLNLQVFLLQL